MENGEIKFESTQIQFFPIITSTMIYLIYENNDLIIETDNPEFVEQILKQRPDYEVKQLAPAKKGPNAA